MKSRGYVRILSKLSVNRNTVEGKQNKQTYTPLSAVNL